MIAEGPRIVDPMVWIEGESDPTATFHEKHLNTTSAPNKDETAMMWQLRGKATLKVL